VPAVGANTFKSCCVEKRPADEEWQMAISHKARYCNGFPHFVSNTEVLEPPFYSMLLLSFRSIPVLSGHKSGHIFSGLHDNEPKQQDDNKNICFIEDLSSPITTHSHANPETTSRPRTLPKSSLLLSCGTKKPRPTSTLI
jgi:hypothetical protein